MLEVEQPFLSFHRRLHRNRKPTDLPLVLSCVAPRSKLIFQGRKIKLRVAYDHDIRVNDTVIHI